MSETSSGLDDLLDTLETAGIDPMQEAVDSLIGLLGDTDTQGQWDAFEIVGNLVKRCLSVGIAQGIAGSDGAILTAQQVFGGGF